MRLITFDAGGGLRHVGIALPDEDAIVDLTASDGAPYFGDMLALIDGGDAALDHARTLEISGGRRRADEIRLLAPLPEPRQMRDFLSFETHLRQARANRHMVVPTDLPSDPAKIQIPDIWYEQPIYYKCNRFAVAGPEQDILWPRYAKLLDYELEFGVVIGKMGKNIPRSEARAHIFGYCIFNDVSARDAQLREMAGQLGPAKGKDFDTANVLGPWLVTADSVPDPYALEMTAHVNGELWSRGTSADMHHDFEAMIEHVSQDETLHAGEFLGSGTVGNGCGLEMGRFLSPNDVIELEVSGLGRLRNRIVTQ
jgi:2-keto-4-pentenoate hydratase/2-oxohepta-3-ene-1,7-dioic acid hydratase in catechol pathway